MKMHHNLFLLFLIASNLTTVAPQSASAQSSGAVTNNQKSIEYAPERLTTKLKVNQQDLANNSAPESANTLFCAAPRYIRKSGNWELANSPVCEKGGYRTSKAERKSRQSPSGISSFKN